MGQSQIPSNRRSVFVSYAHEDKNWLDRFTQFVQPLTQQDELTVCSDQDIGLGDDWKAHIQSHLNAARVAVLLVSPAFLASKYVRNSELPVLFRNARDNDVTIIPIILRPCLFAETKYKYPDPTTGPEEFTLASIQAAGSPSKALSEMEESEQDRTLLEVARQLISLTTDRRSEESVVGGRESSRPAISVCTITKRTQPRIAEMIRLLKTQTFSDIEYLIIDGYYHARRDHMTKLIDELAPPFRVRYLPPKPSRWQHIRPALCNARNTYLIWAEGELIIELDDCCIEMSPDLLEKHLGWSVKGFAVSGSSKINAWDDARQVEYPDPTQIVFEHFYCPNRSFALQSALKVNGYEELLDGEQGNEDVVLGFRLSHIGVRFMYDPTLRVEFDASSHTLTQLSPDPRKARWGKEVWAVEPKTKVMSDGKPHYANEWLADQILTSKQSPSTSNRFTLSELREIPIELDHDIGAVQKRLEAFVDTDPKDWRDDEPIASMSGGEFVHFRDDETITTQITARNAAIAHAAISGNLDQISVVAGRILERNTRSIPKWERIQLDGEPTGIVITPLTSKMIVPTRSRTTQIYDSDLMKIQELRESEDVVQSVGVSQSEKYLAAGGWDSAVHVWDFATYEHQKSFKRLCSSVTAITFLDDARHLVAGTAARHTYAWDVARGAGILCQK